MKMNLIYSIAILLIFWSLCYLINTFLLECSFTSGIYAKFLSKNGLTISFLQIKWYTVKCNRFLIRLSNWRASFWKWWFNMGVIIGVIGQFASLMLLCYTLYDFFRAKPKSEQILVPIIPGVNLPSDQTLYYLITLFICGIFHEFGHAIAASCEQVRVNGFGVFLAFIFPGAYVDLNSDHLMVLPALRQLRIFCGGVWHNLILVLFALACIKVHPYFVSALFVKEAFVSNVINDSPLKSIIESNTIIRSVANCEVTNSFTWYKCLYDLELNNQKNQPGYCMALDEIFFFASNTNLKQNLSSIQECCTENTSTNYCFHWLSNPVVKQYYACLPARYTTDKASCLKDSDCLSANDKAAQIVNVKKSLKQAFDNEKNEKVCLRPVNENGTQLIRIVTDKGQPILYVGSVKELLYSVVIDEYKPRIKLIPNFLNRQLQLLLKYVVAFSGAIAILNLVPCYALDGQYILGSILSMNKNPHRLLIDNAEELKYPKLYKSLMYFGTGLLVVNILLALCSLALSNNGKNGG